MAGACLLAAPAVAEQPGSAPAFSPPRLVTAAVLRSFPPQYSTDSQGNPTGFAIDMMEAIARRSGLVVRYRSNNTWDELYDSLRIGSVDLIPNIGITKARQEFAIFTEPVETFSISLFVRSNSPDVSGLEALGGRRVAVVRNNVGIELVKSHPDLKITVFPHVEQALTHLLSGTVDALVFPEPVVWKILKDIGLTNRVSIAGPPLLEVKRAIGVSKHRPELVPRLNAAIASLVGSSEFGAIHARWYGDPPSLWNDETVWWAIGGAFGAVVLLMAGWRFHGVLRLNRQLRMESAERVRAELQLRQAQKMEAVGQLAGGVAHDFNNTLQIIRGYTELARASLQGQQKALDSLEKVLQATGSAATLTRQLLAFSRREALKLSTVEINALITRQAALMRRLIGHSVELVTNLGKDNLLAHADAGMLEQVLMNLVLNAQDAMPRGGRILIETRTMVADEAYRRAHGWAASGPYVEIRVSDTGVGMSPEVQQRIFDPFFTTKRAGEGTGLGLSVVYNIVQQHSGAIVVQSTENVGTTFVISIPQVRDNNGEGGGPASQKTRGGSETVLVAEDDANVLSLLAAQLEGAGYRVLSATDGAAAVRAFEEHRAEIDMVILDVVMPKMGGREAFERIRGLDATVPILFSTGHTANEKDGEFIVEQQAHLLRKPYSSDELLRSVRSNLDQARQQQSATPSRPL